MQYSTLYSQKQQQQRYEDYMVAEPTTHQFAHSVWAVFDGHKGDGVAQFLSSNLVPELERRLPAASLPNTTEELYLYTEHVRRAVLAAFLQLSLDAQQQYFGTGCGSTATVVVQTGQLLTVANAGSTRCVLDAGNTPIECTADHRLGNSEEEEERLDAAGACIARLSFGLTGPAAPGETGCGPLRLWPGGLHMSRAIGDHGCGQLILPHPYIHQMWLPQRASRLIIATGSVWDAFDTYHKAASGLRGVSLPNAAGALLQRALRHKQHRADKGDLSVLVVDLVPHSCSGFSSQMRLDRLSRSSASSGCSSHQGISIPAVNLFRRSAAASRLPAHLSLEGMELPPQQQQQQQHNKLQRLLSPRSAATAATATAAAAAAATTTGPAAWSPVLTPCSSGRSLGSSVVAHVQQPQQPQLVSGLLERLLQKACLRPGVVGSSSVQQHQQHDTRGYAPSLVGSCGSSSCDSTGTASSTQSSGCWSPRSSSSLSRSSVSGMVSSWQKRKRNRKGAAAAAQHQQPQQDPSTIRIIARCDTFQAYFRGKYQPLEKQLAVLNMTAGWPTLRPSRSLSDLAAKECDKFRRRSTGSGSVAQQQHALAISRSGELCGSGEVRPRAGCHHVPVI